MTSPSTNITASDVESLIRRELLDLDVEETLIVPEAKFDALAIDSLDVADLMTSIQREFGVKIPRSELVGVTIGELAERVAACAPR